MDWTDKRRTLAVVLAYRGDAGHGWQRQKDGMSIQHHLRLAVADMHGLALDAGPEVYGASRTDVGVHARCQLAVADVRADIPPRKWVKGLNTKLPPGIRVRWAAWARPGFRPRAGVGDKVYCYRFSFAPTPDPLRDAYEWWVPGRVDPSKMAPLAATWLGQHDFAAAHNRARSQSGTTIRTLTRSEIIQRDERVEYWVAGPGFLTHQVRILAGTLVDVATGQLSEAHVDEALQAGQRRGLGRTAPARGLTLEHIDLAGLAFDAGWPGSAPNTSN